MPCILAALTAALRHDHACVNCSLCLCAGASRKPTDQDGLSPLHHAAMSGNGDAVALLIQLGCARELRDAEGRTALHCAAELGKVSRVGF